MIEEHDAVQALPETRVSFSSLNWLEKSPAYYQGMINGSIPKEETASMIFGRAVHSYILQGESFDNNYVVVDYEAPQNKQQVEFAARVAHGENYLDAYKGAYSTGKKSEALIEKEATVLSLSLKSYIDYLKQKDERSILQKSQMDAIHAMNSSILKHETARNLLTYGDKWPDAHVYTEKEFLVPIRKLHDENDLYIHGFIDHLIFDPGNRRMKITELKTTSQDICDYPEAFVKYKTSRQLAIYTVAAGKLFEKEYPDVPLKEMSVEWNVIAVQSNGLFETRVFIVTEQTIMDGMMTYKDLINRYVFHYKEGWDYPQEYYTNNGVEYL